MSAKSFLSGFYRWWHDVVVFSELCNELLACVYLMISQAEEEYYCEKSLVKSALSDNLHYTLLGFAIASGMLGLSRYLPQAAVGCAIKCDPRYIHVGFWQEEGVGGYDRIKNAMEVLMVSQTAFAWSGVALLRRLVPTVLVNRGLALDLVMSFKLVATAISGVLYMLGKVQTPCIKLAKTIVLYTLWPISAVFSIATLLYYSLATTIDPGLLPGNTTNATTTAAAVAALSPAPAPANVPVSSSQYIPIWVASIAALLISFPVILVNFFGAADKFNREDARDTRKHIMSGIAAWGGYTQAVAVLLSIRACSGADDSASFQRFAVPIVTIYFILVALESFYRGAHVCDLFPKLSFSHLFCGRNTKEEGSRSLLNA